MVGWWQGVGRWSDVTEVHFSALTEGSYYTDAMSLENVTVFTLKNINAFISCFNQINLVFSTCGLDALMCGLCAP